MSDAIDMSDASQLTGLHAPDKVWFELHHEKDACDVIVQMDDGTVYTAIFVIFGYLERQMQLHYEVTQQMQDTPPVRYTVMDTPHILVDELTRDIIEDTIDNLIALDVFESHFTRVTEHNNGNSTNPTRTSNGGRRATQEVAAVVISDVLVVED